MSEMNIWLCVYTHQHGNDITLCSSRDLAIKCAAETIKAWWEEVTDRAVREEMADSWRQGDFEQVMKVWNDWHPSESLTIEGPKALVNEDFNLGDLPPEEDDIDFPEEEEAEPPVEDGELKGKIHNFDGVAARVVADDGERWMTVVMIGDDGRHRVDRDDFVALKRNDYCGECGQVGCACDGLDREEDNDDDA